MEHFPVLKEKVVEFLNLKENGVYVDGTCGFGGHSKYILETKKNFFLIGIDKDEEAISTISERLKEYKNFRPIKGGFENIKEILESIEIKKVDGVLLDLGFSINQVKNKIRGFSLYLEGPLDMRYDRSQNLTADEILNKWSMEDLKFVFENYGDIKNPEKIVKKIIERRKEKPFQTTIDFANFISKYYPRKKKIHPATLFFQALRIAVNNEICSLKKGLTQIEEILNKKGRLVVISFHSIEDRIVKNFIKKSEKLKVLTKKPVSPDRNEVILNPESRSAKLRAAEKL